MGIFRPYKAKVEMAAALERGYWFEKYDMTPESRKVAERALVYLRIRYPWPNQDRRIREDRDF